LIQQLEERWPRCFAVYERRRRRLKVGIHGDIIAALEGVVAPVPVDDTSVCFIGRGCSRVRSADVGVEPRRTFI